MSLALSPSLNGASFRKHFSFAVERKVLKKQITAKRNSEKTTFLTLLNYNLSLCSVLLNRQNIKTPFSLKARIQKTVDFYGLLLYNIYVKV